MTEQAKKYRKLNPMEAAKVVNLLDVHFDKERRAYRGEWNDEAIAKAVAEDVPTASVSGIRVRFFGHLKEPTSPLTLLTARVTALEADNKELRATINRLIRQLGADDLFQKPVVAAANGAPG